MALLRVALALMKLPSIDLLVVGLTVSHFMGKKAALESAVTGTHDVGGGKTVVVRKGLVVAQPPGARVLRRDAPEDGDYRTRATRDHRSRPADLRLAGRTWHAPRTESE